MLNYRQATTEPQVEYLIGTPTAHAAAEPAWRRDFAESEMECAPELTSVLLAGLSYDLLLLVQSIVIRIVHPRPRVPAGEAQS